MTSAVFNTSQESYPIAHIAYAGPVTEIPEKLRKEGGSTHSFKLITSIGASYCYFANQEAARNARGALAAKFETCKPFVFKYGYELIDPLKIVSFSTAFPLKTPQNERTHAFTATFETSDGKNTKVWFTFKSQDTAQKARRALVATIHSANDLPPAKEEEISDDKKHECEVVSGDLPF